MKCAHCQHEIKTGVIVNGDPFCNKSCAEEHRLEMADAGARHEGFSSYEDMMEYYGATIAEDRTPYRGY